MSLDSTVGRESEFLEGGDRPPPQRRSRSGSIIVSPDLPGHFKRQLERQQAAARFERQQATGAKASFSADQVNETYSTSDHMTQNVIRVHYPRPNWKIVLFDKIRSEVPGSRGHSNTNFTTFLIGHMVNYYELFNQFHSRLFDWGKPVTVNKIIQGEFNGRLAQINVQIRQIEELLGSEKQLQETNKTLQKDIQEQEGEYNELKEQLEEQEIKWNEEAGKHAGVKDQFERLRRTYDELDREKQTLLKEHGQFRMRLRTMTKLNQEKAKCDLKLESLTRNYIKLGSERDELLARLAPRVSPTSEANLQKCLKEKDRIETQLSLKNVELERYVDHNDKLQLRISELEENLTGLQEQYALVISARAQSVAPQKELETARARLESLHTELTEAQTSLDETSQHLRQRQLELSRMEDRLATQDTQINEFRTTGNALRSRNTELQEKIVVLRRVNEELVDCEAKLETLTTSNQQLRNEISKARDKIGELQANEPDLSACQVELREQKEENVKLTSELRAEREDLERVSMDRDQLLRTKAEMDIIIESYADDLQMTRDRIAELESRPEVPGPEPPQEPEGRILAKTLLTRRLPRSGRIPVVHMDGWDENALSLFAEWLKETRPPPRNPVILQIHNLLLSRRTVRYMVRHWERVLRGIFPNRAQRRPFEGSLLVVRPTVVGVVLDRTWWPIRPRQPIAAV